jgi:hypothetical protein
MWASRPAIWSLTVGKRMLRWGTGYAFTATGVLDPPRVATDPTDRLSLNQGREMGEADWVAGKQEFTVVWASAGLLDTHRPGARETPRSATARWSTGSTRRRSWRTTAAAPPSAARISRACSAMRRRSTANWPGGNRRPSCWEANTRLRSGLTAIAEFYTPPNTAYYRPSGMPASVGRRHYGFLRVGKARLRELPGWKEWDVTASWVANFDDGSRIAVFDAGRRFGNRFHAYLHAQTPGGKRAARSTAPSPTPRWSRSALHFKCEASA